MKKPELLAPAGDLERLKIALLYGADAVYIGGAFNLRANADNFKLEEIKEGVEYAHKLNKKVYYNHSGFPGGLRERTAKVMKEQYPVEMVERAVKGMLPKNRLGRQMYKKLFVYEGMNHNHEAQKPEKINL